MAGCFSFAFPPTCSPNRGEGDVKGIIHHASCQGAKRIYQGSQDARRFPALGVTRFMFACLPWANTRFALLMGDPAGRPYGKNIHLIGNWYDYR